jgi:hypothetical protein
MSVFDKFKESLSPEDFVQLEESVTALIDEKAKIRAELMVEEETKRLEALAEEYVEMRVSEKLAEETKKLQESFEARTTEFKEFTTEKLQEISEKYVSDMLEDAIAEKTAELVEEYNSKYEKLEESVIDNLDKFIDLEISTKIDSDLIKQIAINEAYKPIVTGIIELIENNFVQLDKDGGKIVAAAEAKVAEVKTKLDESYSEKVKLQSTVDTLKTKLLISEKVSGLTESHKSKVLEMFEGKDYSEVSKKIDTFVELLEENNDFSTDDKENNDVFTTLNESVDDVTIEKPREKTEREITLEKLQSYL